MVEEQFQGDDREGPRSLEEEVGRQYVDPRLFYESQMKFRRGVIPHWVIQAYHDFIYKYIPDRPNQATNNKSVQKPPEKDTP